MLLHRQLRWLGHVIRMPHSRLPHCVLYGQLKLGGRSVGGQKKRFKDHIKSNLIRCNIHISRLETLASERATWVSSCAFGMSCFDDEYDRAAALRRSRRHQHAPVLCPIRDSDYQFPLCGRQCYSRIGLLSHSKPTFNIEEKSSSSAMDGLQKKKETSRLKIKDKVDEKILKYKYPRIEILKQWNPKAKVMPIIVASLGATVMNFEKHLMEIPGKHSSTTLIMTAVLDSSNILRRGQDL